MFWFRTSLNIPLLSPNEDQPDPVTALETMWVTVPAPTSHRPSGQLTVLGYGLRSEHYCYAPEFHSHAYGLQTSQLEGRAVIRSRGIMGPRLDTMSDARSVRLSTTISALKPYPPAHSCPPAHTTELACLQRHCLPNSHPLCRRLRCRHVVKQPYADNRVCRLIVALDLLICWLIQ